MERKELLVPLYLKDQKAVQGFDEMTQYADGDAVRLSSAYDNAGADGIVVFDFSADDAQHDDAIAKIKEIARTVDIPLYGGGNIRRLEDVKKLIYAGCKKVFLNFSRESNVELSHEASARFGKEKILACVRTKEELDAAAAHGTLLGGILLLDMLPEKDMPQNAPILYVCSEKAPVSSVLKAENVQGVCAAEFMNEDFGLMDAKHDLCAQGIAVNTYESSITWDEIKVNSDGLLPVIVQDYKTQEVLMEAYMNRESFEMTIRTGRMTYWSRSRQELWIKGLTSGHFQYVKELRIDCDNDTLLAKVAQVGAACHTGNRSCFYRTILKKEYDETNPLKVFEDVFDVIRDRKLHPKEGSYTNYLFDKGIDKILKKVGEEATEIIIAAKNPDPEEIKYEISDFLYHVMVLMVQRGVSWEDITKELARR